MAVEADLDRVGEVPAELDKQRPEVLIQEVEVIVIGQRRAPRDPGVAVTRQGILPSGSAEHGGLFLRLADKQHAFAKRGLREVLLGHIVLALAFLEGDDIDVPLLGKALDVLHELLGHGRDRRGGGNRTAEVSAHEVHEAALGLQPRDVAVEIQPVNSFNLQHDMASDQFCHALSYHDHGAPSVIV